MIGTTAFHAVVTASRIPAKFESHAACISATPATTAANTAAISAPNATTTTISGPSPPTAAATTPIPPATAPTALTIVPSAPIRLPTATMIVPTTASTGPAAAASPSSASAPACTPDGRRPNQLTTLSIAAGSTCPSFSTTGVSIGSSRSPSVIATASSLFLTISACVEKFFVAV